MNLHKEDQEMCQNYSQIQVMHLNHWVGPLKKALTKCVKILGYGNKRIPMVTIPKQKLFITFRYNYFLDNINYKKFT